MSTAIGHCCAALGVAHSVRGDNQARPGILWILLLCIAACAPDIDYAFHAMGISPKCRFTHSISIASLFPAVTIILWWLSGRGKVEFRRSAALFSAGFSHLLLDLLVGVSPQPLFWPFTCQAFRLPFGILPSAGAIRLRNPYLYRNLAIELGVLLPLLVAFFVFTKTRRWWMAIACGCVSIPFMVWAAGLPR